jgi:quercetin dioxygenase-like cupin family protein
MIEVKSFATLRRFDPAKLQKLALFESERFFCDVYCLLPGQEQKIHAHEGSDKVYAVIEGTVEIRVAGETRALLQGEAALAPAGKEHGVANRSAAPAALLVFLSPRPGHGG